MKLLRATFSNVMGVADRTVDFADRRSGFARDLVVITGPPGSGKTRLLEALIAAKQIIAPQGQLVNGAAWLRPGAAIGRIDVVWQFSAAEQRRSNAKSMFVETSALLSSRVCGAEVAKGAREVLMAYDHEHSVARDGIGKLEYFASNRALPPPGAASGTSVAEQRMLRAGSDERKYAWIPRFIVGLESDPSRASRFAARLAALSPTVRYEPASPGRSPLEVFTSRGAKLRPTALSSTEMDAVLLAATATLIGLSNSIALVDGPELGADDASLPAWLHSVRALGEDLQVIAATSRNPALLGVDAVVEVTQ